MPALLAFITSAMGVKFQGLSPAQLIKLGLGLAPVALEFPHILKGEQISPEGRLRIEDAIAAFEREEGL